MAISNFGRSVNKEQEVNVRTRLTKRNKKKDFTFYSVRGGLVFYKASIKKKKLKKCF